MGQVDKENFMLIDTRPTNVHRKSFIPGSVSLPWAQWDMKQALLPRNLSTRLIFYCGGHG